MATTKTETSSTNQGQNRGHSKAFSNTNISNQVTPKPDKDLTNQAFTQQH